MPKIVDHEQQRALILDLGLAAFAARGYGNLSMRELAKEIGLSFGTLYHYFPSKEVLFHALLERQFRMNFLPRPPTPGLSLRARLEFGALQLQESEQEVANSLALQMDYVQVHGEPFTALDGQTPDDLLDRRITESLSLTPEQARLVRRYAVGVLILRRLHPSALPLSEALEPLIELMAPNRSSCGRDDGTGP